MESSFSDVKEAKDMNDAIKAIQAGIALHFQMKNPTRSGMIAALQQAQTIAANEIIGLEWKQGNTYQMPWDSFPDHALYEKLPRYIEGLKDYCINKIGKEAFEKLLRQYGTQTETSNNSIHRAMNYSI